MTEKKLLDPEYEWILRTCTNAFNVYMTMMHFVFYDNALNLQPQNSGKLSETKRVKDKNIRQNKDAPSRIVKRFRNLLFIVYVIHDCIGSLRILHLPIIGAKTVSKTKQNCNKQHLIIRRDSLPSICSQYIEKRRVEIVSPL